MKDKIISIVTLSALLVALSVLGAQTVVNGGRTVLGAVDNSGATTTKPSKTGTSLPGTCAAGETYIKTDATAANQLYICTSANTWTAQGGAGGGSVTTVADAGLWLPFGGHAYNVNGGAITATTVYLYAASSPHWTEATWSKFCAGISGAAASGKYLAVGVYARAANKDLSLLSATRFLVDSTVVSTTSGRCAAADHGSLPSGGVFTLGPRADIMFAMCSDGAPSLFVQGSPIAKPLNEWNASTYTEKLIGTSTATPCTGTGSGLTMPSSITAANYSAAELLLPLLWTKR